MHKKTTHFEQLRLAAVPISMYLIGLAVGVSIVKGGC